MVRKTEPKILVLFDGVCNLCNGAVQFLIRRDKDGLIQYASLQSQAGQNVLKKYGGKTSDFDSIVVLKEGNIYQRSDAVIVIGATLGFPWNLLRAGEVLPRRVRDWTYNVIARNRYRIFGRRDECMIPDPQWKSRFLD